MTQKEFQCLMVETPDHRHFFTHEKNYPQLLEFSQTFGAEISIVKVKDANVLTLEGLAPALCDPNYQNTAEYEIIEPKLTTHKKPRPRSKIIRDWIKNQLITGKTVKLNEIFEKFSELKMTKAAFCTHYTAVRKELTQEGWKIEKVGGGTYQAKKIG
jgi:hypothetical protein